MDYQIALPPDLDISPADFVTAWNETEACRAAAEATLSTQKGAAFDPTLDMAIFLLSTVSIGLATNAIYDLLKEALRKAQDRKGHKNTHKRTQITKFDQPDGTHLLVVTIEEE